MYVDLAMTPGVEGLRPAIVAILVLVKFVAAVRSSRDKIDIVEGR